MSGFGKFGRFQGKFVDVEGFRHPFYVPGGENDHWTIEDQLEDVQLEYILSSQLPDEDPEEWTIVGICGAFEMGELAQYDDLIALHEESGRLVLISESSLSEIDTPHDELTVILSADQSMGESGDEDDD